ncbi:right-handed parallel beta-helix repeat-containing protein [Desertivirga xinjiangensis]|uniref:right-handed parallel beta-helix repeat-containing protein n=1 Tax=Desertivirga xinjiangensis TaxID=539206 RepID=UPI00210CC283|nr:right-handed parallel beta-helix repeat-containing protein [Pedobacter xinjiangensis]
MRFTKLWISLVLAFFFYLGIVHSQTMTTKIKVADWNIHPNTGKDCSAQMKRMLDHYSNKSDLLFEFSEGRFDFWQQEGTSNVALHLQGMKNVTIDGKGASLVFHGKMKPFLIRECTDTEIKNISIDWQRPFISQAEIINTNNEYIDIKINKEEYPYRFENGMLTFYGENWSSRLESPFTNLHTLYDKVNKEIVYRTRDNPLGNIFLGKAEEIQPGLLRFYGKTAFIPDAGTIVTLYHGRYITPGIEINRSKNTVLEHVTVYHALSHGILGERSENITVRNSSMTINEKKGRVFSTIADASHFTNCRGKIIVDSCGHAGMGDDFLNCHGIYVKALKRVDDRTLEVSTTGRYRLQLLEEGDEIYFVGSTSLQRESFTTSVTKIEAVHSGNRLLSYRLTMQDKLPEQIGAGYYLENKTWSASLEIRNCQILKKHRARGILVTTPNDVIIENNYFRTAGAAILIEGDLNHWFESGANNHVIIRNNVFEDCLSSGPEWGEAVITITPSIRPSGMRTIPYHRNIRIENNQFKHYDRSLLYARSVDNLSFKGNKVEKTDTYLPFSKNPIFYFDGCRRVKIEGNEIELNFSDGSVTISHMEMKELKVGKKQGLVSK